ncbi:hypothetical protein ELG67_09755 [Rhizobium leguminosarum]|uniref:AAA family ATPase n=1 Tax=Rhizobium leguminosarum TaxID=384 RepID=UPI0010373C32|nr:AAA family ATPase [Rhizobium leguminosarum]TBG89353.1 hypothetical protein ELG67_09755 [Rhizobium leguminosarum]
MIEQISVDGVASYKRAPAVLANLRAVNFIFGANGSGKTTISRVIANPAEHPTCSISWTGNLTLDALVYNRDFVEQNFVPRMQGIFTLGHEDASVLAEIDDLKGKIDAATADIRNRRHVLEGTDGKGGERMKRADLDLDLQEKCWATKIRYEDRFKEAFRGVLNSRANFAARMFNEFETNTSELKHLDELVTRAETVFADVKSREDRLPACSGSDLLTLESSPILAKRVFGKVDVPIAGMIRHLRNSDWVRQGLHFFHQNGDKCPFCQQATDDDFRRHLEDYFDETYQRDVDEIAGFLTTYVLYTERVTQQLDQLAASTSQYLDQASLHPLSEAARAKCALNIQHLQRKRSEPSAVVELEPMAQVFEEINALLAQGNARIDAHNSLIDNIVSERQVLVSDIWRYIVDEASINLDAYRAACTAISRAIDGLTRGIEQKDADRREKTSRLRELERQVTSVQPTVNAINQLLASFGFNNFTLATAQESNRFYRVVRGDGTEARETLSEGERTFIVFLYFYHLIGGSVSESGVTTNRIVVIDDPVSSLDSDVLFIVSSLIKKLFVKAQDPASTLKQVFVLTHNVYFHKEVSFDPTRGGGRRAFETFWVVRKRDELSVVEGYDHNPIKSSYEMLWQEVRDENRSVTTIQNVLRRIIENYFTILGNMDKDTIIQYFQGQDQQICNSLFSWVNDGSHHAYEDLYLVCDANTVERYLDVFKRIFQVTNHGAHYDMMATPRL